MHPLFGSERRLGGTIDAFTSTHSCSKYSLRSSETLAILDMAYDERQTLFAIEDQDLEPLERGESSGKRSMSNASQGRMVSLAAITADGPEDTQALLEPSRATSMTSKTADDDESFGQMPVTEETVRVASKEQKAALWWRNFFVTGIFVALWYTFATLLSVYNKWMFSPEYYGFSFPLFVTFCHMLVQWVLAALVRTIWPRSFAPPERPSRKDYFSKVLPTAVATGGDIGLSNLSLKTITLTLYTMCKSSALIFVLGFAFLFRLEKFSLRLVGVITFISIGVFFMVFNVTSVSIPGIIMVFCASAIGGLRWALTSLLMHRREMGMTNPFATIYWLAPLMALSLAIVSLALEGWLVVLHSGYFDGWASIKTILVIIFPGTLAFSMVASEYYIIQRAGVVPLSIAGIFKEVTTITISAWVFGDRLTHLNVVGVVITIFGIALYSYHKYNKSIESTIPLDSHGNPIPADPDVTDEEIMPLANSRPHSRSQSIINTDRHAYPPLTHEEDIRRQQDEFEGWNERDDDDSDTESERRERERAESSWSWLKPVS